METQQHSTRSLVEGVWCAYGPIVAAKRHLSGCCSRSLSVVLHSLAKTFLTARLRIINKTLCMPYFSYIGAASPSYHNSRHAVAVLLARLPCCAHRVMAPCNGGLLQRPKRAHERSCLHSQRSLPQPGWPEPCGQTQLL